MKSLLASSILMLPFAISISGCSSNYGITNLTLTTKNDFLAKASLTIGKNQLNTVLEKGLMSYTPNGVRQFYSYDTYLFYDFAEKKYMPNDDGEYSPVDHAIDSITYLESRFETLKVSIDKLNYYVGDNGFRIAANEQVTYEEDSYTFHNKIVCDYYFNQYGYPLNSHISASSSVGDKTEASGLNIGYTYSNRVL